MTVSGTVLVVDDEPKIREVLRGYLESEGEFDFGPADLTELAARTAERFRQVQTRLARVSRRAVTQATPNHHTARRAGAKPR